MFSQGRGENIICYNWPLASVDNSMYISNSADTYVKAWINFEFCETEVNMLHQEAIDGGNYLLLQYFKKACCAFHLQVPAATSNWGDCSAPEEEAAETRPADLVSCNSCTLLKCEFLSSGILPTVWYVPYCVDVGIAVLCCRVHAYILCVCPLYCRHLQCLVDCAVHFTQESLEVSLGQCAATLLLDTTLTGDQAPEEVRQITESARTHAVDVNTPISFFTSWSKANKQHSGKWCVCACAPTTHTKRKRPTYLRASDRNWNGLYGLYGHMEARQWTVVMYSECCC